MIFYPMTHNEYQDAEKTKQQECIEYFGRLPGTVVTHFRKCPVPVIKRQQRLNYSCNPEKSDQACNKNEHFPRTDLGYGKMALGKNYTDYKEDCKPQQLEKLQARDVIDQFYLSQTGFS